MGGILWGVWEAFSGVFGRYFLGCLRCATQGLGGDNRRTGVKMDLIELARRIPS